MLSFVLIDSSLLFKCTYRPVYFQEEVYNGKDCVHALKFQTVMLADGIISHVSGPWSGRRHDTYIFINSELPQTLGTLPRMPHEDGGELMAIYADPGKIRLPGDCGICACFVTATAVCFSSLTITQDTH